MARRKRVETGVRPYVCLICGRPVSQPTLCGRGGDAAVVHEFHGALRLLMPGNYGSGVWDPLPTFGAESRLEGAVCDGCLTPRLGRVRVVRLWREHRETYSKPYPEWEREQAALRRERRGRGRRGKAGRKGTRTA